MNGYSFTKIIILNKDRLLKLRELNREVAQCAESAE